MSKNSEASQGESYSVFFGVLAAIPAIVFCTFGAAYGIAKTRVEISTMAIRKLELIMKYILHAVLYCILAITYVVCLVVNANVLHPPSVACDVVRGFVHFVSGLVVGFSGLVAGITVGDAGVRGSTQQQKLVLGMFLIFFFVLQVLGLYVQVVYWI